jgi:hypothetical protein
MYERSTGIPDIVKKRLLDQHSNEIVTLTSMKESNKRHLQKEVEQLPSIVSSLKEVGSGIDNHEFLKEDNLLTLRRKYFFRRMHCSNTPLGRIIQTPVASQRTNLLDVSSVCIKVGQIDKMREAAPQGLQPFKIRRLIGSRYIGGVLRLHKRKKSHRSHGYFICPPRSLRISAIAPTKLRLLTKLKLTLNTHNIGTDITSNKREYANINSTDSHVINQNKKRKRTILRIPPLMSSINTCEELLLKRKLIDVDDTDSDLTISPKKRKKTLLKRSSIALGRLHCEARGFFKRKIREIHNGTGINTDNPSIRKKNRLQGPKTMQRTYCKRR